MKAAMVVTWVVLLSVAGCSDRPPQKASVTAPPPGNAPVWEIGGDIAGTKVMIDGKDVVIPDHVANTKREMDAVAQEKLEAMDALEKERLQRFNDPDLKP
ncbi:MAG: hypothetical protein ABIO38_06995 [Luteimonas sp.]